MFAYCTSLKNVTDLPATTLTLSCYDGMFEGCTRIVTPPQIYATTLAIFCC
jgi:hypothetical protein